MQKTNEWRCTIIGKLSEILFLFFGYLYCLIEDGDGEYPKCQQTVRFDMEPIKMQFNIPLNPLQKNEDTRQIC